MIMIVIMFSDNNKDSSSAGFRISILRKTWYSGGKISLVVVSLSSQDPVPMIQSVVILQTKLDHMWLISEPDTNGSDIINHIYCTCHVQTQRAVTL